MLVIPSNIAADIIEQARQQTPVECCGLLAGIDGVVSRSYRLTNVDASPEHFSLDPKEQFAAVKDIRREDIVIQKGIIFKIIENLAGSLKDIEAKHVEETLALYDRQVGKQIHLPYGIIAEREYHAIRIYIGSGEEKTGEGISGSPDPLKIEIPGSLFLPQYHKYLKTGIIRYEKDKPIPENTCTKWFDYDKIENAVELRARKEGDYILINSEGGRKKLKDYFIDRKVPKSERGNRLLVCDGSHVMWILGDGERISEKYKINPNTKKILWMNLVDAEEKENGR
jgi:tRNA(Ile)-lysidine synthase